MPSYQRAFFEHVASEEDPSTNNSDVEIDLTHNNTGQDGDCDMRELNNEISNDGTGSSTNSPCEMDLVSDVEELEENLYAMASASSTCSDDSFQAHVSQTLL
jgi:hypothetical protein